MQACFCNSTCGKYNFYQCIKFPDNPWLLEQLHFSNPAVVMKLAVGCAVKCVCFARYLRIIRAVILLFFTSCGCSLV